MSGKMRRNKGVKKRKKFARNSNVGKKLEKENHVSMYEKTMWEM